MNAPLRWGLLAAGLAVSVLLSVLLNGLFLFLLLPLLFPVAWRRRPAARPCPSCGRSTSTPGALYCPHDGTRLL